MLIVLTISSVLFALIMTVVAWRASGDERRRSEARIAALAQDIHQPFDDFDLPARVRVTETIERAANAHLRTPQADVAILETGGAMFATAAHSTSSGSRWGLALAVGAFVVASAAAIMIVFSGEAPNASAMPPQNVSAATPPAPQAAPAPLELVALGHERDGDQLTVRGIVRNPAAGTEMDRLTAVVSVFNRDGGFLTSGRAAVASPALIPGGESTFVVTMPAAGDVGRYRVSFRSDEHVISHVDKRSTS
jgi:hypothetical protein